MAKARAPLHRRAPRRPDADQGGHPVPTANRADSEFRRFRVGSRSDTRQRTELREFRMGFDAATSPTHLATTRRKTGRLSGSPNGDPRRFTSRELLLAETQRAARPASEPSHQGNDA